MLLGAGPRGQVTAENMPSLSRGLLGDDRKSDVAMENLIVKLFDYDSKTNSEFSIFPYYPYFKAEGESLG